MQTRPYPEKDGVRIWLARSEQEVLVEHVEDHPRKRLAFQLGLHGLRTDEVLEVTDEDFRDLQNGAEGAVLVIQDGKTGKREVPVSDDLRRRARLLKNTARLHQDDPLIDVTDRTLRNWIESAAAVLEHEQAGSLGMHDLRRTWATDTYYALAFAGVPIAEQLTMSWGGWKQTQTGRDTFRQNYLGPVPDHITADAREYLSMV